MKGNRIHDPSKAQGTITAIDECIWILKYWIHKTTQKPKTTHSTPYIVNQTPQSRFFPGVFSAINLNAELI